MGNYHLTPHSFNVFCVGLLILTVDKMNKRGDERGEEKNACMVGLKKIKEKTEE